MSITHEVLPHVSELKETPGAVRLGKAGSAY